MEALTTASCMQISLFALGPEILRGAGGGTGGRQEAEQDFGTQIGTHHPHPPPQSARVTSARTQTSPESDIPPRRGNQRTRASELEVPEQTEVSEQTESHAVAFPTFCQILSPIRAVPVAGRAEEGKRSESPLINCFELMPSALPCPVHHIGKLWFINQCPLYVVL